jgi:hypothetical protein
VGAEKASHSRGDRQTRYLDAASAALSTPSFAEAARATLSHPLRQLLLFSSSVNWRESADSIHSVRKDPSKADIELRLNALPGLAISTKLLRI